MMEKGRRSREADKNTDDKVCMVNYINFNVDTLTLRKEARYWAYFFHTNLFVNSFPKFLTVNFLIQNFLFPPEFSLSGAGYTQ